MVSRVLQDLENKKEQVILFKRSVTAGILPSPTAAKWNRLELTVSTPLRLLLRDQAVRARSPGREAHQPSRQKVPPAGRTKSFSLHPTFQPKSQLTRELGNLRNMV